MKNINREELNKILKEHELWLKGEGGKHADLSNTDLSNTDLSNANLRGADLNSANLSKANLNSANLSSANLSKANLKDIKTNIHTIGYNLACPEKVVL